MSTQSSRRIIRDKAKECGWKRLPSKYPLQDRFGKNGKKVHVWFAITGSCVQGTYENEFGWATPANNRKRILEVLNQ